MCNSAMPDERAIMTYVSSYYHCFAGKIKVNNHHHHLLLLLLLLLLFNSLINCKNMLKKWKKICMVWLLVFALRMRGMWRRGGRCSLSPRHFDWIFVFFSWTARPKRRRTASAKCSKSTRKTNGSWKSTNVSPAM